MLIYAHLLEIKIKGQSLDVDAVELGNGNRHGVIWLKHSLTSYIEILL